MRILFAGDIVGKRGTEYIKKNLRFLREELGAQLVIANGENSADGNGILPQSAEALFFAGVDVITGGNHSFRRKEIYPYIENSRYLLRPYNYPAGAPGQGFCICETPWGDLAVANLMGVVFLDPIDCPFAAADRLLKELSGIKAVIIDFHAEATSEKRAFAEYVCGRVSAVLGTHTHVQTADEKILMGHTGFITDVGMTGPSDSVLGVKKEDALKRFLTKLPAHFGTGDGPVEFGGVLVDIDMKTGACISIERVLR